eukprot:Gregarina_sp_Pseudo_9__1055@NODE_1684_length_1401_cov_392_458884_g1560_i0_p1_GENE_NODE_1684_length_1401_cov_392_458884_g1560_i0NODE_1684_length_1401_cov_392_458884_g1560_i0_p1_ORF_typecomplete_len238_score35_11Carb_anhydrase/PF00194_21/1e32_NODE_1684_length_1401_cov_392_458884_g1560_i05041217
MGAGNYSYSAHDWAELSAQLRAQSPIQIPGSILQRKQAETRRRVALRTTSQPMELTVTLRADRVAITGEDLAMNRLTIDGRHSYLKEIHFHSPSEHLVDGDRYSGEMHCVFVARDGSVSAVLGFILERNSRAKPNRFLRILPWEEGERTVTIGFNNNFLIDNFAPINANSEHLFLNYVGSLTTPPCTEGVEWLIQTSQVHPSDLDFLNILKTHFGGNYRLPQPLNGRQLQVVHIRAE